MLQRFELFCTTYMKGWCEIIEGTIYTKIRTREAAVVLPYEIQEDGTCRVVLLKQPRPESVRTAIKTVGGYCGENETQEACAKRNLLDKLGIETDELRDIGPVLGYSVAEIPIRCYLTDSWSVAKEVPAGLERMTVTIEEAVALVKSGELLDDSTSIPIMRLALELAGY